MSGRTIIVLGGGVAGLSTAHELAERGTGECPLDIHVVEKRPREIGGKARSTPVRTVSGEGAPLETRPVDVWNDGHSEALPAEHGFRFFPGFYRNLPDTMARIPTGGGKSVRDNLVDAPEVQLARTGKRALAVPTRLPTTFAALLEALVLAFEDATAHTGLSHEEIRFFAERIWQILTSCDARKLAEYEQVTWARFLEEKRFDNPAYTALLVNGLSRSLLANDPQLASARTVGNTDVQLLLDMLSFYHGADRLLNGPTTLAWLAPWRRYLFEQCHEHAQVTLHAGETVERLVCADGAVSGVVLGGPSGTHTLAGDLFVACLPVERMAAVLEASRTGDGDDPLRIDPRLENVITLSCHVAWMNGVQFYLLRDVPLVPGHSLYVNSPWALTSISEMQFWKQHLDLAKCDDGRSRGILSVCISDWKRPGILFGKPASECTRDEIRQEVWAQVKAAQNVAGAAPLADDDVHAWYLDEDVTGQPGVYTDAEPLFINKTDAWRLRPDAATAIPNLFLASDYVKTSTDVACMEAANEAARRAVNALLPAIGPDAEPCEVFDLSYPNALAPYREADAARFARGLPWNGELTGVPWDGPKPAGRFVEHGGMQCHLQPYDCQGSNMYGFLLEGTRDALQKLVDRYLNHPSQGAVQYRVLSPFAMVTFMYVEQGLSVLPPDAGMGYIPETSWTMWIPAGGMRQGHVDRIRFFCPYIAVDNAWSMTAGREVYGFPKEIGTFVMPSGPDSADRFSVATDVLKTFERDNLARSQTLFEIHRSDATPAPSPFDAVTSLSGLLEKWLLSLAADLADDVLKLLPDLVESVLKGEVHAVFLKQFRDVADGRLACYQAVTEVPVRVTRVDHVQLLHGQFQASAEQFASHPLQTDFGFLPGPMHTHLPYYVRYDFRAENGVEVWRSNGPRKIAVLGGGVGAMSAVCALTSVENWQEKFDITVYQLGWRLGGKGASGRNQTRHERIEEHGLHLWFGYYDQAFAMMRRIYHELGRDPSAPLATWKDAFKPHGGIIVGENLPDGTWDLWPVPLPTDGKSEPGDGETISPLECVAGAVHTAILHFIESHAPEALRSRLRDADFGTISAEAIAAWRTTLPRAEAAAIGDLTHDGHAIEPSSLLGDGLDWLRQLESLLAGAAKKLELELAQKLLRWLVDEVSPWMEKLIALLDEVVDHIPTLEAKKWAWRLAEIVELGWVSFKGFVEDEVLVKGFDAIDDRDYREWMQHHGGTSRALNADVVRVAYETIFAYENGDTSHPNLAAGVALNGLLRLAFGWKGAVMWKMQAGMGDTIFGPIYQVLKRRGVKFEFFQRVDGLELSGDRRRIATIRVAEQAELIDEHYQPLRMVKGLPCWPSEPLWAQLTDGAVLQARGVDFESWWCTEPAYRQRELRHGIDFDEVVLGISLGALPEICAELVAHDSRWQDMVRSVPTIQTQAFQIWTTPSLPELGWKPGSGVEGSQYVTPVLGGYAQPQNTWADMSNLIGREDWPAGATPGSVSYFCGPMQSAPSVPRRSQTSYPIDQAEIVRNAAVQWVRANLDYLLPGSTPKGMAAEPPAPGDLFDTRLSPFPEGFDWLSLIDLDHPHAQGVDRFLYQYWRANVDPTERYVLSPRASIRYRLPADDSGFANLFLAGDWTRTSLSYGCVEAAVLSGWEAAKAICDDVRPFRPPESADASPRTATAPSAAPHPTG